MATQTETVRTTCPYCGVGCGVLATPDGSGGVTIKGDPEHPANRGRLCSKGAALGETLSLEGRLLHPEVDGERVSWERAIREVAGRFKEIIAEHGPDAVALYVSGQLLTEDYYLANKLMKGYIGSANIDTNSRLCMSSAVAGYKRAFGEDVVPCSYEDLERAKMIVLTGSNTAWCHPVLYQRIAKVKKANPDLFIVLIDPRRTQTTGLADLHLAIRPGRDGTLFNGLLTWLEQVGEGNTLFTDNFTRGMEAALEAARRTAPNISSVAAECGLAVEQVAEFYRLFARTERVVTVFSQGINQSSSAVDKVNAIINCHLYTGRIGRPGMGPFSFTGQPNAMGGREVGGLANQLAAHMELADPQHRDRVQRFWDAPAMAQQEGLKAVELFQAVAAGRVKAVWIMATNPVVSLPEADAVKAALEGCELVVVSDCVGDTDTARLAQVRLPALSWGEKEGTVTNSERCISRQRRFLPEPGEARPDWWIIGQVAQGMGFTAGFAQQSAHEIFLEHAALSGFENEGERSFDISGLAKLGAEDYAELEPCQWPINVSRPEGTTRLYGDGRFNTADGKARFIPVTPQPPASVPDARFPLVLNTGRVRDHWHTLARTSMSSRLSAHTFEPYAEIHPQDAAEQRLQQGDLAEVASPHGSVRVRVKVSAEQQRGSLFVPMHWNDTFSARGRVGALVRAITDPVSGQPESKHSVARIQPLRPLWQGFILTRRGKLALNGTDYWTRSRGNDLWRYEIAANHTPADWGEWSRSLLGDPNDDAHNWVEFFDRAQHHYRAARFVEGRLESCLFVGRREVLPERDWLIGLFAKPSLESTERQALLTGRPPADREEVGRIVCACFSVGLKTIEQAIKEHGLSSAEAIGERLQAGTNCGSCVPELRELLG